MMKRKIDISKMRNVDYKSIVEAYAISIAIEDLTSVDGPYRNSPNLEFFNKLFEELEEFNEYPLINRRIAVLVFKKFLDSFKNAFDLRQIQEDFKNNTYEEFISKYGPHLNSDTLKGTAVCYMENKHFCLMLVKEYKTKILDRI